MSEEPAVSELNHPQRRPARLRVGRPGFTMIEILVVIGIILVLVGLAVVGFNVIDIGGSANLSRQVLGNVQGMMAELEAAEGLQALPVGAIDSPGDVNPGATGREPFDNPTHSSYRTHKTRTAMRQILRVPANQDMLKKLPSKVLLKAKGGAGPQNQTLDPPKLADGWGNPILFVPGPDPTLAQGNPNWYGLRGLTVNNTPLPSTQPIRAPNNRPFWASAGPDGNFTTHDDNLYSFDSN